MQLHISPSLRHVTVFPGKGVREFINVKVGSRQFWHMMVFYTLCSVTFLLWFVSSIMPSVDTIDGPGKPCSPFGCLGRKGRWTSPTNVPEVMYQVFEEPSSPINDKDPGPDVPVSFNDFMDEMRDTQPDAITFARRLKSLVRYLEQKTRLAKIQEYLYRHVASSSIPKQLHCLTLRLANEHTTNSSARDQIPDPQKVPHLVDNSYLHFVLASDNVLAASVVANSLVQNARHPKKIVLHIITDRKTFSAMHAWFSLHPLNPAVIEVKALHQFEFISKGIVPVLEAMEKDQQARSQFRGGSEAIVGSSTERPKVIAAKLQAMSPKYNSIMNHIRIHLPELFPSLDKIVFLDDDIVIQTDLSPLWDIDMGGKVNGAVATCKGEDKYVMSKRLKSYLNFSHPLISNNFDPEECAWAYGMNVFDLKAWRKTNVTETYHHWLQQNLKSDLSLWQLGTLPPGLIAFHGHVHTIDPFWHMLGLGYQEDTSVEDAEAAGVIHFNGRAKPWLDLAFPQLRPLWTKYIDFSDRFIKGCNIKDT